MNRRARRLDEYVRQATAPSEDRAAMLVDPVARRDILEEITRMQTPDSPASPRLPARRHVLLAALAAAVAVVSLAALASTTMFGAPDAAPPDAVPPVAVEPTGQPQAGPSGDVFGDSTGFSCVEQYTLGNVATRSFAFAGTVARIGQRPSPGDDTDPYVSVVFTVDEWFRGGQGNGVTVWMFPPDVVTSAGNTPYQVGSRLLVSGERWGAGPHANDLLAWPCGFTRWYSARDAAQWQRAFR